mmetsp:Transcript_48675/g.54443  ORF Transcript_48675/g.54443 Transcript_48675/m.54443 type:complete len:134 (+) Transcript_48675:440-841(+)
MFPQQLSPRKSHNSMSNNGSCCNNSINIVKADTARRFFVPSVLFEFPSTIETDNNFVPHHQQRQYQQTQQQGQGRIGQEHIEARTSSSSVSSSQSILKEALAVLNGAEGTSTTGQLHFQHHHHRRCHTKQKQQ